MSASERRHKNHSKLLQPKRMLRSSSWDEHDDFSIFWAYHLGGLLQEVHSECLGFQIEICMTRAKEQGQLVTTIYWSA